MSSLRTSLALCLLLAPLSAAHCDCELTRHHGTTMHCSGCSQNNLPSALVPGVVRLNLSGNQLTSLATPPGEESALASITVLYADGNNISEVREGDTCAFSMLRILDLSKNKLQVVEEKSIECNRDLERLVLDDNPGLQLEALQSRSLTHLFLERCDLRSLDKRLLSGLTALRYLYVRGNPELHCAKLSRDFQHLDVYCGQRRPQATDLLMLSTTTIASTSASPHSLSATPNNNSDNHSSRQKLRKFISPLSIVLLVFIILLILILVPIFVFRMKCGRNTEANFGTADRKLLQDPC